ncbi:MAG: cyclic nucleotide-binding domain-containing protein [Elusimicrobia bacterium]|nr:cyclic nucleotide-binding domain-containing protein [Candidatus Liberimonas magnetica]
MAMSLKKILRKIFIDEEYLKKRDFLKSVSLFSDLNKKALNEILEISFERSYLSDEVIFEEGDLGRALYIVKSGEVAVYQNREKIYTFHPGNFFGEIALSKEVPRTATVKAVTDCTLILIYKVKFDAILEIDPSIGIKMKEIIDTRFNKTNDAAKS